MEEVGLAVVEEYVLGLALVEVEEEGLAVVELEEEGLALVEEAGLVEEVGPRLQLPCSLLSPLVYKKNTGEL